MGRLIIDGNRVYELDEECLQRKRRAGQRNDADRNVRTQNECEKRMQKKGRS